MNQKHLEIIASELSLGIRGVESTAMLLSDGATVPFISRYRKEATGSLDEVAVAAIRDRLEQLEELDKRREAALKSIKDQGLLNADIEKQVLEAPTMSVLEDIYLPFRPKRRTRATIAKEKGLGPFAESIFSYECEDPLAAAQGFINPEKELLSVEEALSGARDIIAEKVSEDQETRSRLRRLFQEEGVFLCRVLEGKEVEGAKYRDYFEWQENVISAPSHRILAVRRGEKEGILSLKIAPPEEKAISLLEGLFVREGLPAAEQVREAVHDAYRRLLASSMETEIRAETKKRADQEAINVFSDNLRELLLAPPLGSKRLMGIDPGFRTGCKWYALILRGSSSTVRPFILFLPTREGMRRVGVSENSATIIK